MNSDHSFCKLQSLYILTQLYFYRSSCYYNLHTKLKIKQIISDAIINCKVIKTYSNIGVFQKRVLPNLIWNNLPQQKQKTWQFKIRIQHQKFCDYLGYRGWKLAAFKHRWTKVVKLVVFCCCAIFPKQKQPAWQYSSASV